MMLKKVFCFFAFLFATIVLLAHAVVPHHHHGGISCIHHSSDQHHNEVNESCLLTKVYLRWCNDKQTLQLHDFDYDPLPCLLTLLPDYSTYQIKDDIGLPFGQKPYLLFCHTEFTARSKGLRAPPFFN